MEMVRHEHKLMEKIFVLFSVTQKNLHKQISHPARLKQTLLLKGRSGNKVSAESSVASVWRSHSNLSG
jgi:hypothetical protein